MSHVRQQIREAAASALSGTTDAGTYVYSSLYYPVESTELPIIHIFVDGEESDYAASGGLLQRSIEMVVRCVAEGDEASLDNDLDALAVQVEAVLGGNLFSNLAKSIRLIETQIERNVEGVKPTAAISLTFTVEYFTNESDGETAL